jgi:hypothetical protein
LVRIAGRRVIDHIRDERGARDAQIGAAAHVAEHRLEREGGMTIAKLALHLEQRVLGMVQEDKARGSARGNLPRQLGADRSPGARDEHPLPGQRQAIGGPQDGAHRPPQELLLNRGRQAHNAQSTLTGWFRG